MLIGVPKEIQTREYPDLDKRLALRSTIATLQDLGFFIDSAAGVPQLLDDGAARGFDLLRLSVYWDMLEPTQGTYDEDYLADLATVLDRVPACKQPRWS